MAKVTTGVQMAQGHGYKPERLQLKDLQCRDYAESQTAGWW